jgi:hypothetical protein
MIATSWLFLAVSVFGTIKLGAVVAVLGYGFAVTYALKNRPRLVTGDEPEGPVVSEDEVAQAIASARIDTGDAPEPSAKANGEGAIEDRLARRLRAIEARDQASVSDTPATDQEAAQSSQAESA